jgi:hypothetical protein
MLMFNLNLFFVHVKLTLISLFYFYLWRKNCVLHTDKGIMNVLRGNKRKIVVLYRHFCVGDLEYRFLAPELRSLYFKISKSHIYMFKQWFFGCTMCPTSL